MPDSVLHHARTCEFSTAALRELASLLPADDAVLDRLLELTVRDRDELGFTHMVLAAVSDGRPVDAAHLVEGSPLLPNPAILAAVAIHCSGDVPEALVEAVGRGKMGWEREAVALLTAGWWSREHREGELPPHLLARARKLARLTFGQPLTQLPLVALAELLDDAQLRKELPGSEHAGLRDDARRLREVLFDRVQGAPLAPVPERAPPRIQSGYTVRRAVERIGRNEPCPCGSGRKYKRCCYDADQERLRHSSDVPGVTVEELRGNPEVHLNSDRLQRMRSYELARLAFDQVPAELHRALLSQLNMFREFGAAIRFFEVVGCPEELVDYLVEAVDLAATNGDTEAVRRLISLRDELVPDAPRPNLGAELLAAENGPDPQLARLEAEADRLLREEKSYELVDFSCSIVSSPVPALGILLARGVLPLAALWDQPVLEEAIIDARDRLGLPLDDPIEDVASALFSATSPVAEEQNDDLAQSRQILGEKNAEVRTLRAELATVRHQLETAEERHASPLPPEPTAPAPLAPAPDPAVNELRRRVASLKGDLKQRHQERNQLRRELHSTQQRLEELRSQPPPGEGTEVFEAEAQEEALVLPEEAATSQPVRVPSYPPKFLAELETLPDGVVRSALRLIGGLAAGDAAAFQGARRLKRDRDIWRQKVGASHRLLFRLGPRRLETLALVTRQEFERAVKRLTS